ncbi:hypothetical protein ACIBI4_29885 [Streptomyces sp. NPDC050418]|uniref:hypothetical protein n=1 Tax=Streptomyces sp. NPDC050418 TaxID=3365612 RepID=UPI0037B403E8
MRRIQILRVVAGLLAMVWILVSYRIASDAQAVATQRAEQMANSAALLAVTFPVIVGVFLAASRPPRRSLYLRRARGPLGALLSMGAMIVYMVLLTGEKLTGGPFGKMPEQPDGGDYLMLVYQLVLTLVAVWGIGFVLWGAVLSVIHVFRTTDIHEVLPPLIAIVLVWELSLLDLFSSAYDSLPTGVWLAAVFGGPLSVTAVSLWELRRLRTRHGLTIRGALGR